MRNAKGWKRVISPDIHVTVIGPRGGPLRERHLLLPGHVAEARVHPIIKGHPGTIPQITTRSILARLGVEVHYSAEQMPELLSGVPPSRVLLTHSGEIPVRLRRGNRTHRIYYPTQTIPVRKSEMDTMRQNGTLVLGKDFRVYPNGFMEIAIQPTMYELDPAKISKIARQNWISESKRKALMKHFKKVGKEIRTRRGQIVLTETLPVKLPKDTALFLQSTTDGRSYHIHSLVIDPGFEGPIVLELFGIQGGVKPEKVRAWLMKVRGA
jgi:deoxycytidine triphosphate deaminase